MRLRATVTQITQKMVNNEVVKLVTFKCPDCYGANDELTVVTDGEWIVGQVVPVIIEES